MTLTSLSVMTMPVTSAITPAMVKEPTETIRREAEASHRKIIARISSDCAAAAPLQPAASTAPRRG